MDHLGASNGKTDSKFGIYAKKKLSDKVTNKSKKCHLEKRSTVSQRWSTITQLVNGQSVEREGVKK